MSSLTSPHRQGELKQVVKTEADDCVAYNYIPIKAIELCQLPYICPIWAGVVLDIDRCISSFSLNLSFK